MTQFNAWPLGGGVWVGPVRRPRNSAANEKGSIHDDAVAQKLGFRGGTVAASLHMEQFPPLLLHMFGRAGGNRAACRCTFATQPPISNPPNATRLRRCDRRAKTSASKCGWSIRKPERVVPNASPTARRRSVVRTSARHCGSAFRWSRTRVNCASSRSCRERALRRRADTHLAESARRTPGSHHRTSR